MIRDLICSENGQGLAEYSLLLSLVFIVVIVAVKAFGIKLESLFKYIVEQVNLI